MTPLSARRLLAVMPHPDDEAYAAAGTLALAAQRGAETALLCVTAGEGGGDAAVRHAELSAACRACGTVLLPILGWPDGALPGFTETPTANAALQRVLVAWRPDVILGLGSDGVYGHLDHLALHQLLRRACAAYADDVSSVSLWEACFPVAHFHPVWRRLRRGKFPGVDKGWTPERFGTAVLPGDLVVDISDVAPQKRAAIAAHESQLRGRAAEDFLLPGLMAPLLRREHWREVALVPTSEVAAG